MIAIRGSQYYYSRIQDFFYGKFQLNGLSCSLTSVIYYVRDDEQLVRCMLDHDFVKRYPDIKIFTWTEIQKEL